MIKNVLKTLVVLPLVVFVSVETYFMLRRDDRNGGYWDSWQEDLNDDE